MRKECLKLVLSFLLIASLTAKSEDWTSTTGTTYKNVIVIKVDSDSVTIKDDDGTAVVSLSNLPLAIKQRLMANAAPSPAPISIPINGQVFIVTKGGQNFKLGGIHVRIYSLDDIGGIIKRRQEAAAPVLAKLRPVLKDLSDAYWKVERQQIADGGNPQWYADMDMENKLNAKMAEVRKRCDELSSGEYFLSDLPPPVSDVQTDADGKFTAAVQATDSYVITASASREVGDYIENYHWIVKMEVPDKSGKNVLLTNGNMIYQNSPDSLVNAQ
jgi:hypothetical protein